LAGALSNSATNAKSILLKKIDIHQGEFMRILIVASSNYIAFHGQAIFTINLAEGLARNGNEVMVAVGSDRAQPYREQINGVQLEAVRALSLKIIHPDSYLPLFPSFVAGRILDAFRPDIVHIQDHYPLGRAMVFAARRRGIKLVGTNHFMPDNLAPYVPLVSRIKPFYNWVLWHWMREVYDRLDAVAGPSRTAAEMLKKVGVKPPVSSISCGVNTNLFHLDPSVDRLAWRTCYGIDPIRKVFFFVGRVDREKRLDVIIRAIRLLDRDDIQLVIAGNGAAKVNLMALVQELGLKQKVHFTGFIPNTDLPSVLNSIDIFTMPSEAELLSIASLQAMACARPMLVADAVALPELVTANGNGLLFRPGDVDDAARCMTVLVDHPERWSAMGAASLERVQAHSLENIVHRYEQLYQAVLSR
jgi:glycosyltransferase involved in cell wall biosynthesis